MTLEDLGFTQDLEQFRVEHNLTSLEIGRVIAEHKERYVVRTTQGEYEAEITGNMRFAARSRQDFPVVGDWVALTLYESDFAIIHSILPRFSTIQRQAVGQFGEIQLIATNIDFAFLVQAADRDFNINRLERYLAICNASQVSPIIVITKVDLLSEQQVNDIIRNIQARISDVPVFTVSNESLKGVDTLMSIIQKSKTYCMLGSSGVGKSTLLNNLSGKTIMHTGAISESTHKGRHITSHRELIILEKGGIVIDNPGMREVGIADAGSGLEITFDKIMHLSRNCRFKDCKHLHETGCAVLEAVEKGEVDRASYENYLKMEREKAYFDSTLAERRKRDKVFGRMTKNFKKDMKKNQS